jgi:hypothetical protein
MTRALLYKELRETLPIAAVGLACLVFIALDAMEYSPLPNLLGGRYVGVIPFLSHMDQFFGRFAVAAGAFAIALGFWHSLGDFWGEAHLFLLHRPVNRRKIYVTKLFVGIVTYLLCAAAPILLYALWAATPGTHASPFDWSMTLQSWSAWFAAATVYLGAFLAGLRPAAWLGTRLVPLFAAGGVLGLAELIALAATAIGGDTFAILSPLLLLLADISLIAGILTTADSRDFA